MPLPADVAADIDQYVDRVIDAGKEASVDAIQLELVNKVLRPFLHIIEKAREEALAPEVAEHAIADLMANCLSEFVVRLHTEDDGIGARVHANQLMLELANRTSTCMEHNYGPLRPADNKIN